MDTLRAMDALKGILIDLGIPAESLDPDTLLYKDLQLDSTEIVEVSLGLKRRLGVNVKLETQQDRTLAQVCEMVKISLSASSQEVS